MRIMLALVIGGVFGWLAHPEGYRITARDGMVMSNLDVRPAVWPPFAKFPVVDAKADMRIEMSGVELIGSRTGSSAFSVQ